MSCFTAKMTTCKGVKGEDICFEYLRAKGHTIYRPDREDRAHPIDSFVVHGQKFTVCAADVKTKPKREAYPDTGINMNHYGTYCYIKNINNIRVFLFFVDENTKEIYGNWLDILEHKREVIHKGKRLIYPMQMGNQMYFPLSAMIKIADISDESVEELKAMRNSKFTATLNTAQNAMDFDMEQTA